MGRLGRMIGNLLRRREAEESLDAELHAFVDDLTRRNLARGMAPGDARRNALLEAGGIEQVKENVRDAWLGQSVETTLQDIRYAVRTLKRSPGFTTVVVATLALGIGANLVMFSLMRAVLWRPLPYPEPERIVMLRVDARNTPDTGATMGEIQDLREQSRTLAQISFADQRNASLELASGMEYVSAALISDDFLPLLGTHAATGRLLAARMDANQTGPLAAVISDELWHRRFGADASIVGRAIRIDGVDVQVVGILPPGFRLYLPTSLIADEQVDVWLPYRMDTSLPFRGISVAARLRPGVTLQQANAELATLVPQFARKYPAAYTGGNARITVNRIHERMTQESRPALFLLFAAVGFVLLIACVNVANLMVARGAARQRELEIRRALGAGRVRILRQLLTESALLAAAAAGVGLLWTHWGLEAIRRLGASHIPMQSRMSMDGFVAAGAVLLSLVTTLAFGLLPAWRLASGGATTPLRAGRSETASSGARRLQRTLVALEVALSILPLACGGLMLRSFVNLMQSPLGFRPDHVVTAEVPFDVHRFAKLEQRWALLRQVFERVRALPRVQAVSAAWPLPLAANQQTRRVGRADQVDALPILATQQIAAPGYLDVIGTPLREGRDFTAEDVTAQRNVTIIDEGLAKRLWPEGAIGRRLVVYRTGWRHELEIVGVTSAIRTTRVRDGDMPHFMMPYDDYPGSMTLVLKSPDSAESLAQGIRSAVDAANGGRAAFDIRPMSAYVADSVGDTRFLLLVLAAFAGAAVLLAAVGLYGTLAYLTAQRTREFGIRLALGSSVTGIVTIVIREGVLLASAGAVAGLMGVAAVTHAMREMLYGVRPLDGPTLAGVVVLVGVVALAAAGVPAWRATRIDPQASLRSE